MINLILRFIGLFSRLWVRLGVNPDHLDAILRVKLTMDDRRPGAFNRAQQRKSKKEVKNVSWVTIFMAGVMGAFYLYLLIGLATDDISGLTLFFIMFMLMLAITLVADFSYVLIDVKDNYIILPKPVSSQTVLMSRLLHILIHLSKLVLPMSIPGLVYMCIHAGAGGALAYLLDVLLATLMCIFFINAAYLVVLKFTTAERFKDIIGAVQVVFSVFLIIIYLVVPHSLGSVHVDAPFFLNKPYLYWLPPLWLAALWEVLRHPVGQTTVVWGLGIAGLVLSPLSMWVVVRFLAPSFNRRLSGLVGGSGDAKAPALTEKPVTGKTKRAPGYLALSRWLTRGSKEATGFEIAWLLTGRYRDFKMKVYPSFAYVIVYFIYFILIGDKGKPFVEKWHALPSGRMYILLIYSSSLAMISAIGNMVYSEKYKAAWVYYSSPIEAPGQILTGAVKAMIVKYFVPFYVLICVLAFWIWGMSVLPDLILGFVNILFFGGLLGLMSFRKMPFSAEVNVGQGSGRFMRGLFMLLIPGVIGVCHYLIRRLLPDFQPLIWVFAVLSGVLVWMVYSKYRELSWSQLDWS